MEEEPDLSCKGAMAWVSNIFLVYYRKCLVYYRKFRNEINKALFPQTRESLFGEINSNPVTQRKWSSPEVGGAIVEDNYVHGT